MNASQIHLALTHVPVILSFVGLVILVISFFKKNETTTRIAFYILLAAGLFAILVYATGEGTEEVVEKLPGVSEAIIEKHEDIAAISMIIILLGGTIALAGLLLRKFPVVSKMIKFASLFIALASAVAMAQTAHLGGQIRHSEIRSGFLTQNDSAPEDGTQNSGTNEEDDD